MSCNRGKASPDSNTKLRLFADSAGYCQNPDCLKNLFHSIGDNEIHIAERAHIFSANDNGPRADNTLTPAQRGTYNNLILLCPTCHTMVDKAENFYTDDLIKRWKLDHKNKVDSLFNVKIYDNRIEIRKVISSIFMQNKIIFDTYGPMTEDRFNPESKLPLLWKRKIRESILPNNRKILNMIDANYRLLTEHERVIIELYRQHVVDFEAKHINEEILPSGIQFPIEINNIFLDSNFI